MGRLSCRISGGMQNLRKFQLSIIDMRHLSIMGSWHACYRYGLLFCQCQEQEVYNGG